MSRGASGEASGRLVEEKVGVTAGIVTVGPGGVMTVERWHHTQMPFSNNTQWVKDQREGKLQNICEGKIYLQ